MDRKITTPSNNGDYALILNHKLSQKKNSPGSAARSARSILILATFKTNAFGIVNHLTIDTISYIL